MKLLSLLLLSSILPLCAADDPAKPDKAPKEVRKLLSKHSTLAEFTGISFQACRHLTSRCPNKCTHAGKVATFKIVKYIKYVKPGKYGDPKRKSFRTMIEDQLGNAKVPVATLLSIKSLKKGDSVRLEWNHDYVTRNRSSFPERTIIKLSKVEP